MRKPGKLLLRRQFDSKQLQISGESNDVNIWGLSGPASGDMLILSDYGNNCIKSLNPSTASVALLYRETGTVWQLSMAVLVESAGHQSLLVAESKGEEKRLVVLSREVATGPFIDRYDIQFRDEVEACNSLILYIFSHSVSGPVVRGPWADIPENIPNFAKNYLRKFQKCIILVDLSKN